MTRSGEGTGPSSTREASVRWQTSGPRRVVEVDVPRWTEIAGDGVAVWAQLPDHDADTELPVVVLCHGLGGDQHAYAGLGRRLAGHGYAVLHPQFLDSMALVGSRLDLSAEEQAAWPHVAHARDAVRAMLFDPWHWQSRVERVHTVVDSLAEQNSLPMRLAPTRVIVAGHSFGAYTAQALVGTKIAVAQVESGTWRHAAVSAAVLMSPQGSGDRGLTPNSWDEVDVPVLLVTATKDFGAKGEPVSWRREPFDRARSRFKHLAVVRGGDHLLGGLPFTALDPADGTGGAIRDGIAALVTAFADSVHGDPEAGRWLASGPVPEIFDHEHADDTAISG